MGVGFARMRKEGGNQDELIKVLVQKGRGDRFRFRTVGMESLYRQREGVCEEGVDGLQNHRPDKEGKRAGQVPPNEERGGMSRTWMRARQKGPAKAKERKKKLNTRKGEDKEPDLPNSTTFHMQGLRAKVVKKRTSLLEKGKGNLGGGKGGENKPHNDGWKKSIM